MKKSTDLAINNLCYEYEYFQDGVYLNSFDCVVVHKKVKYTNKTERKDGLRYMWCVARFGSICTI